jgi:anti-sigma B factor antagonist
MAASEFDGHAVVALRGEFDLAFAPSAGSHLVAAVAVQGPSVIVDLAGLESIGYCGLGILVRVLKWTRESGGDLVLAAPRHQVRRVLPPLGRRAAKARTLRRSDAVR